MTYQDIITKFLIEYDKMITTASYPSLTTYEICTVLDKAYLAIISNKLTGINPRKAQFESDNKSIEDIRPLLKRQQFSKQTYEFGQSGNADNEIIYGISQNDWMYYIEAMVYIKTRLTPVQLVSHLDSQKFKCSIVNKPWMEIPVVYIEGSDLHLLFDVYKYKKSDIGDVFCTYIKKPVKFVDNINNLSNVNFESNDNVVEEIINMAIIMSAEITESPRMQTKLSINQIES